MTLHRCLSRVFLVVLMFSTCLAADVSNGRTILIDDFNDCNDDGWTRDQIGTVGNWDPGFMHEPDSSCAYRLAADEGSGTLVGAAWDGADDPIFSDGFFRATVRAETPETAFLMAIRNQNPPVFGDAYVLLVNLRKQRMSLEKVVGLGTLAETDLEMRPNEDWYIEIGAVGKQLSARAWRVGDPEPVALLVPLEPMTHHHRLGTGGWLVKQRGVGDVQTRQVRNHGLEIEKHLQAALGNLGLVGCVLRVPSRVLQHVPLDHGRGDGVVITLPNK